MKGKRRILGAILLILVMLSGSFAGGEALSAEQKLSAYSTLYSLAMAKNDYEGALTYVEKSLSFGDALDDATRADLLLKKGYVLICMDRSGEAAEYLDQCLALAPTTADAILLKIQLLASGGDGEGAFAQAEGYIALYPDQTTVYYSMGDIFGARAEYENAIRAYTLYLEKTAVPDAAAYQMRGQFYLQSGRYQEAVADLTTYLDGAVDGAIRARYLRAVALMQTNEYEKAATDLTVCCDAIDAARQAESAGTAAETFDEDVLRSFYYRGIALMQSGRHGDAIADFNRSIEDNREADNARFWRGNCYLETAAYESAIADFEKCIETNTDPDTSHYYIGVCKMSLSDFAGAIDAFTVCIDHSFMLAQTLYNRGMCYIQAGDNDKGQADLSASLALE